MHIWCLFLLFSPLVLATATTSPFVATDGTSFKLNGRLVHGQRLLTVSVYLKTCSDFRYIGTNAYWLPTLNTNQDIWYTLGNISATGIKVVRLWAFNGQFFTLVQISTTHLNRLDVDAIPTDGTWFQLVRNGTVSVNNGPNGLQKLDTIVQMAQKHGLYLILSLTNNWYPFTLLNNTAHVNGTISTRNVTSTNHSLPRNYLSNDYGRCSPCPLRHL